MIKYFPVFLLLCFSCTSSKLLENNFTVDSMEDRIVSERMLKNEVGDFELTANITLQDSYRSGGGSWAGILFCADQEEATHNKDAGYLFYILENGMVGYVSSDLKGSKISERRYIKQVEEYDSIQVKVIKSNSSLSFWIEDYAPFVIENLEVEGKYITANTAGAKADFNILELKELSKELNVHSEFEQRVRCNTIDRNFTGECWSYNYKEDLSEIRNYDSGSIIKHQKFNSKGAQVYDMDYSKHDEYTLFRESYYSMGRKKTILDIANGTGNVKTFERDGSLKLSGKIKDKKFISPWQVFDSEGKLLDTIEFIPYNEKYEDPNKFSGMISKALLKSSAIRLMALRKKMREDAQANSVNEDNGHVHSTNENATRRNDSQETPPPMIDISGNNDKKEASHIVEFPDKEASFPGGTEVMKKWISENLKYPQTATETNTKGKVYVEFKVLKDGSIGGVSIMRGISKEIDEEAKRLVKSMPKWIPGESKGKPVNVRCRIPILFESQ